MSEYGTATKFSENRDLMRRNSRILSSIRQDYGLTRERCSERAGKDLKESMWHVQGSF